MAGTCAADDGNGHEKYDEESIIPLYGKNTVINHPMAVGGFLHLLHLCNTRQLLHFQISSVLSRNMITILGYLNYPIKKSYPNSTICHGMMVIVWWQVDSVFLFCFAWQRIIKLATRVTRNRWW